MADKTFHLKAVSEFARAANEAEQAYKHARGLLHAAIRTALDDGRCTGEEVATAANISRQRVWQIAKSDNGG